MLVIVISILAIVGLILCIVLKPTIQIKNKTFQTFYIFPLVASLFLLLFKIIPISSVEELFTSNSSVNPVKILILFISISVLSIALDEAGFFQFCAYKALKISKNSSFMIFVILYITISILTVFTSNDIIILTFTPLIIYFCKNAKINPIPYLVMEFTAANTWSTMFIIGNPTNIYLASYFNLSFFDYFKVMALPTFVMGITSFLLLIFLFRTQLKKKLEEPVIVEEVQIENKGFMFICLIHLALCSIGLVLSSYVNFEMYLVCLFFAFSLSMFLIAFSIKKKKNYVSKVYKRAPWSLIPFLLSMFILVFSLDYSNVFQTISEVLTFENPKMDILLMGILSTASANLLNNIPMSVGFASIIFYMPTNLQMGALYASIIGSNVGALFTPIGALAGIMWMSLLKKNEVKFTFLDFMKNGILISFVLALVGSITLLIVL